MPWKDCLGELERVKLESTPEGTLARNAIVWIATDFSNTTEGTCLTKLNIVAVR